MANFEFLKDKKEFAAFAGDCIEAEQTFEKSPNACVKLVRTAMEAGVKWLYNNDRKFGKPEGNDFFALVSNKNFEMAVGKNLLNKIHYCRQSGNQAIHNEKDFKHEDGIKCLSYLFDFVQWIDKNYGKNYRQRKFDAKEIPVPESFWKKLAKYAGAASLGVLAALFLKNKD